MKAHLYVLLILLATTANPRIASGQAVDAAPGRPVPIPSDTSLLEERVISRWDALIAKDFAAAYEYFSPAYRNLFPLEHYIRKMGTHVDWRSVDVKNISKDGARGKVEIVLSYKLDLPPQSGFSGDDFGVNKSDLSEAWVWKDGNWWYTDLNAGGL